MDKSFSFVKNSAGNINPLKTLNIMAYELGAMDESLTETSKFSIPAAEAELGDVISMTRMFCEQLSITPVYEYTVMRQSAEQLTLHRTLLKVHEQHGRLSKCFHYDNVYGVGKHQNGTLDGCVNSFIVSQHLLCDIVGWKWNTVATIGEKHYNERIADIKKYGVHEGVQAGRLHEGDVSNIPQSTTKKYNCPECVTLLTCDNCAKLK